MIELWDMLLQREGMADELPALLPQELSGDLALDSRGSWTPRRDYRGSYFPGSDREMLLDEQFPR